MSSSLTPEQVAEQALKEKAKLEAHVKYLQSQLGQLMQEKSKRKEFTKLKQARSFGWHSSDDSEKNNSVEDFSDDVYARRPRRHWRLQERSYNDFKVDLAEFEGQLDRDLFLD